METTRRTLLAGSTVVATGAVLGAPAAQAHTPPGHGPKPTVVLVHGAFADASGWNDVAARLLRDGYPVIAPANPLRGVASDSAYLASILATLGGPLVLAAHSYGGILVTNAATGNANVKALVYVAAFVPDQGETLLGLQTAYLGSRLNETALDFRPYGGGVDGYIKKEVFRDVFAGDVPRATTDLMWASQRPSDVRTLQEPSGAPAWRTIPSWYLVARNDNVLPAAAQRFMARRARAHTVEVAASHVAMIAQPAVAVELIKRAAG
ncbi:alpha/beta hydrolase [Frankia sp. CNm7]|uniref:Alpha/beta hydrolase n=1 Tax=Frankia nepalensis TaxID=1836974 RepID=A0A937UTG0_9ACTN|nr:alpha/beta hydrolase [Frankia nepalensis]MBL7500478.1 alpha/beta hydrolase [Frankia nepalensis]MBL7512830.1 alpha/beta hydrolase [Frankia nepalensis]MBL7522523.1 alpha/beta hydrolase [Frankia nepalensis]MBL7631230.1 alpha/beta hydrolase [Frankia nepalensis]